MTNNPKQNTLWLLAAISAPAAHFCGCGWLGAACAALAVLPLTCLPARWEGMSGFLAYAEMVWMGAVAGLLLRHSDAYWPSDNDLVVPLTLLALAAVTGTKAAPRVGAVLAFCMALLAVPVAVAGAAKVEAAWLMPTVADWPLGLTTAFLFPALPAMGQERKRRRALYASIVAVALAVLVQGTLSAGVAAALPDPFYQTARTLGHLEPVAAMGMTLGWYAMANCLLQSAAAIAERNGTRRKSARVLALGTAAVFVLLPWQPNPWLAPAVSLLLWVIVPFMRKISNFEKSEK